MPKILYIRHPDELAALVNRELETIDVFLTLPEDSDTQYIPLIAGVTLAAVDYPMGKVIFLEKKIPVPSGDEENTPGVGTTVYFWSWATLDESDDIGEMDLSTDGAGSVKMSLETLSGYLCRAAFANAKSTLGIDVTEYLSDDDEASLGFSLFTVEPQHDDGQSGQVFSCAMVPVVLTQEQLRSLIPAAEPMAEGETEVVPEYDLLGINLDAVLQGMELTQSLEEMTAQLTKLRSLVSLSGPPVAIVVRMVVNNLMQTITYADLVEISARKRAEAMAAMSAPGQDPLSAPAEPTAPTDAPVDA